MFESLVSGYNTIQNTISSKIPTLRDVSNAGASFAQDNPVIAQKIYSTANKAAGVAREVVPEDYGRPLGFWARDKYIGFQEKPINSAAGVGFDMALGAGIGFGGRIATTGTRAGLLAAGSRLGGRSGQLLTSGSKVIEPAMGVSGLGFVGSELYKATPAERVRMAPKIGLAMAGGAIGWKAGGSAIGRWQTRGRTEIPLNRITDPAVARGSQSFPMTRRGQTPTQLLSEFRSNKYGLPSDLPGKPGVWHATPGKFKSGIEILDAPSRSTDMPGLYVSPRVSPYFSRIAPKSKSKYSLFGEPEPIRPSVSRIYTEGIGRLPEGSRTIGEGKTFIRAKGQPGKAYLTPDVEARAISGKVEAEATITPGTILTEIGSKYYTKVGNRRVPIDRFVVGSGKAGKRSTAFDLAAKDYSGYSSLPSNSKGIIHPSYSMSALSSSIKPHRGTTTPYYEVSNAKSKAYPSTISLKTPSSRTKPSSSRRSPASKSSSSKPSSSSVIGSTFISPSSAVHSGSSPSPYNGFVSPSGVKPIPPSYSFLEPPLVVKPKLKQKNRSKKRKAKRTENYYNVVNPIKDIAELMK